MKDHAKSRVFAFVMTISILLSAFPFSFTAAADENAHQLTNDQIAVSDSQAEVMSTNAIGITLNYSQIELELGESQRLTATTNPAGQSVSWQSSNESIAEVSNSGLVTARGTGTTSIRAMFMTSDRTKYVAECTVTVRLKEGEYFLQNKQTGYYADIKGPTMASGTTIHQWRFNLNNSQKWYFTHLGDGYYSIKSANSTTPYYLGVINDSSGLDVDVVLRSGSLTNGMKWKIALTYNGAFKLIPKTGESKGDILATTTSSATNGAKLIQGAYIDNDSYRDEWYIHLVSEYVYRAESAEIYYDADQFFNEDYLRFYYERAAAAITNKYYVSFEIEDIRYSSALNLSSSCSIGAYRVCDDSCAVKSSCNTKHHKGSAWLINTWTSSTSYTCRMVSYALCFYDSEHKGVDGLALVSTTQELQRNTIVSNITNEPLETIIQHELSHNLGANHDTCVGGNCVLTNKVADKWCSACETNIKI